MGSPPFVRIGGKKLPPVRRANRLPLLAALKAKLSCFQDITASGKMQEKVNKRRKQRPGVDKIGLCGYTKNRKGAAGRRLAPS